MQLDIVNKLKKTTLTQAVKSTVLQSRRIQTIEIQFLIVLEFTFKPQYDRILIEYKLIMFIKCLSRCDDNLLIFEKLISAWKAVFTGLESKGDFGLFLSKVIYSKFSRLGGSAKQISDFGVIHGKE